MIKIVSFFFFYLIVFYKNFTEPARYDFIQTNNVLNKDIQQMYPFITRVDILPTFVSSLGEKPFDRFLLKHFSVCLYGDDLRNHISKFTLDDLSDRSYFFLQRTIDETLLHFLDNIKINRIANSKPLLNQALKDMTWISKKIIRIGFNLVLDDIRMYTRDLYQCSKFFSKIYPEKEKDIAMVLEKCIKPTNKYNDLDKILDFGYWLVEKLKEKNGN